MPETPLAPGEKLECVSYAPYRGSETPVDLSTRIEPWRIEEDLKNLSAITGCVRTYSVHQGLDQVAPIARKFGMKVLQGLWLGRDPEFNRAQIETAVGIANAYPDVVRAVVVGNEVLLRGELSAQTLAATIREVKRRVPVPVTYADVWEFWLKNPELLAAVDFVTIHILPYWEDLPISASLAADHVASIRRQVAQSFPGKDIMIGEVGWPSEGRMREGALPSPSNQAKVIQEIIARSKREKFSLNVIEAFDQPWKRQFEGTVGGHWGLLDAQTRQPKFVWGQPVSDHPLWLLLAATGTALAAIVFGAAFSMWIPPAGGSSSIRFWILVALDALAGGGLVGLTIEQAVVESFGAAGLSRSVVLLALAVLAPLVGAAAMARRLPLPDLTRLFGTPAERSAGLARWLGVIFAATIVMAIQVALGLTFDARYRDFPSAAMTAAVLPFVLLTLANAAPAGRRPLSETLAAAVLAACAVFIAFHETLANWQALWLAAVLIVLALTLLRARAARS
jgi:exo-beta-1,3-glucanase (GH17 family)